MWICQECQRARDTVARGAKRFGKCEDCGFPRHLRELDIPAQPDVMPVRRVVAPTAAAFLDAVPIPEALSVLTVTMDRYDLLHYAVEAMDKAGVPVRWLVWDNGSADARVAECVKANLPEYFRENKENIGYAKAVNQLILRTKTRYMCILDPDIEMPGGWGRELIRANKAIPDSGITGVHCIEKLHPAQPVNGISVCLGDVFGAKFFSRDVVDKVGYLCEDYGLYGLEDRDYLVRVKMAGLRSYYLAGLSSTHRGDDCGQQTQYRKHKWDALKKAHPSMERNLARYNSTGVYYVAPPEAIK